MVFQDDYRILSSDPGSHFTGLAISELRPEKMVVLDVHTVELAKLCRFRNLQLGDLRTQRLYELELVVEKYAEAWLVDDAITEAPYYGDSITTYAALTEAISFIQHGLWKYSKRVAIKRIDPPRVKVAVGVPGNTGNKELMREALMKLPDLELTMDIFYLSEHDIDAIAVGYYYYQKYYKGKVTK